MGRFVDRAGRHGPRAEFQLFRLHRSHRPQLDDSPPGPRHVGHVGRVVPRPAPLGGRGRAAGHRRSAGQLRLALVGAGAAGAHLRSQRRQSVVGLLFPLAGRRVVGACLAESLGRIVRRPSGGAGLCRPRGRDRLDETRRLDRPFQPAARRPISWNGSRACSHVVLEPRNLQAYGIALGLLSLVWVVARIIDLRRGIDEQAVVTRPVQRRLVRPPWRGRDAVVGGRLLHSCRSATRTCPRRRLAGRACRRPQRLWPDRMDPPGSPGRNARRDALGKVADRRTGCSAAGGRHAALPDRRPIRRGPGRRLGVAVDPGHRLRSLLDRRLGTGASGRRLPTASRRAIRPVAHGTSLDRRTAGRTKRFARDHGLARAGDYCRGRHAADRRSGAWGTRCQDILRDPRADAGRISCRWCW